RAEMEELGFYVCEADLEDELIRALGVASVEQVAEAQRELASFRTFQKQPAQQERTHEQQLWRWMGSRKIRYARLLVDALDLTERAEGLDRARAADEVDLAAVVGRPELLQQPSRVAVGDRVIGGPSGTLRREHEHVQARPRPAVIAECGLERRPAHQRRLA